MPRCILAIRVCRPALRVTAGGTDAALEHLLDVSDETAATKKLYGLDQPQETGFAQVADRPADDQRRGAVCAGDRRAGGWRGKLGQPFQHPPGIGLHGTTRTRPPWPWWSISKPVACSMTRYLFGQLNFGACRFNQQGSTGRDHNGGTFVSWFAGAGVKAGTSIGQSDEWSWKTASRGHVPRFPCDHPAFTRHRPSRLTFRSSAALTADSPMSMGRSFMRF